MRRDRDIEQEAAGDGGVFADLLDELVREAAFLRHLIDQFLVIIGDAQLFRDFLANGPAAAAELTADGDHFVCHEGFPLALWIIPLYTKAGKITTKNFLAPR